ncbi:hypothetical protein Nepgr_018157 [Nepenthes gracilis]|uniref:Pentatricopeptide repeat-containing protein n=1 Tax=Nepenthes gracilis TaxID=150966 RepID=A0AAD3ST73_NEPGR|nr:hypothetical protein Nepgr_018157 [Nepenthes gracilis]
MHLSIFQNHFSAVHICQFKSISASKSLQFLQIYPARFAEVPFRLGIGSSQRGVISMRDRSKNRKPLQKGRNLSIEDIQTVQALKRAKKDGQFLEQVFNLRFKRLLKFDMVAVLRELIRQNECLLALKVFEDVRMEYWYRPQVLLYADMITALANNQMFKETKLIFSTLKKESDLQPDAEGFNALLRTLVNFNITGLAIDCFRLMKALECLPDKLSFKMLIQYLESNGEKDLASTVRDEARNAFWSLEFLDESEETIVA